MKKILFVHHCSTVGGASWCLFDILRHLDRNRFEPVVLLAATGPLVDRIRSLGIRVVVDSAMPVFPIYGDRQVAGAIQLAKAFLRYPRGFKAFYKQCLDTRPDVVYLNSSAQFFLPWPAKKAGVPKVVLHNREHWEPKGVLKVKLLMKNWMTHRFVDQIFSITECGVQFIGYPEKSLVVRDWPTFDDESDEDVRALLGVDRDKFLILLTGGFNKIKGTLDLLGALEFMKMRNRVAVVVVGCTEPLPPRWRVLLKQLLNRKSYTEKIQQIAEKDDSIFLLPPTLKMKAYLSACNVLVAPFKMPHAAKAALEAQQLGRPVVIYDNQEAREYVRHEKTGLIVPQDDRRALARALDELALHPEKASRLGAAGNLFVEDLFGVKTNMKKIVDIFDRARD